ncbi:MAG: hypothetical protein ACRDD1_22685 [Planctomycetia bacterium]
MATKAQLFRIQCILGEAVSPYDHTFERLNHFAAKVGDLDDDLADLLLAFFTDGEAGSSMAKQADTRRALAAKWALERGDELPAWMLAGGVDPEDAATLTA